MERTHRDIIDRAEQQVSVGVTVDLGLPLKHHSLIVEWFDDLWLLLEEGGRGKDPTSFHFELTFQLLFFFVFTVVLVRPVCTPAV